jgi:riboflavin synthase
MFSGIVQAVGHIDEVADLGYGRRLRILAPALGLEDVKVGDSIAVNGACMTVTGKTADAFTIDVSAESLAKTAGLDARGAVNLEKSLRLGDRIDGHLVSGHVDGTGVVRRFEQRGESWLLEIEAPNELARFLAVKGAVTVNGVSLTVNSVVDAPRESRGGCVIGMNLIPHTLSVTALRDLARGARVNLEVDLIARHVERLLALRDAGTPVRDPRA